MSEAIKIISALTKNVKECEEHVEVARKQFEATRGEGEDSFGWYKHNEERTKAWRDASQHALHLAKISIGEFGEVKLDKEIEKDDYHVTLEEWKESCECGMFIDDDGWGDLATKDKCSNITVYPSIRNIMQFPEWATHVVWYNR
jgi:hypothetical protein